LYARWNSYVRHAAPKLGNLYAAAIAIAVIDGLHNKVPVYVDLFLGGTGQKHDKHYCRQA